MKKANSPYGKFTPKEAKEMEKWMDEMMEEASKLWKVKKK